jgi:hypothetical protein
VNKPVPQLIQLAPMFPELLLDPTEARVAFYGEILAEGPEEIELAARIWDITAPRHLLGAERYQYLAGKVAEAEFPTTTPALVAAA